MLLANVNLFYPSAREWMWTYCVYLGSFTDSDNRNWDLGIFIDKNKDRFSAAIVYGNKDGNYLSGNLTMNESMECYQETWKRARTLNLI